MSLRILLGIAAVYMALVGLGLIFAPQAFGTGAVPPDASPALLAFLRLWGSPLLGIAVLDWLARDAAPSRLRNAVVLGNTVGFATIALLDLWGMSSGGRPFHKVFAVVHLLFAAAFVWAGRRSGSVKASGAGGLLLLGSLAGAPVLPAQTASADSAAIHQLSRQFSAAYMRGDAAVMAGLYTSDGVIFPEQSDWISGRDSIRRYWTLPPGRRITRHVAKPARIVVDGDHAYDYGSFEIAGERDGKAWGPFRGKYVIVWRRTRDSWRMQLDIWNTSEPPES